MADHYNALWMAIRRYMLACGATPGVEWCRIAEATRYLRHEWRILVGTGAIGGTKDIWKTINHIVVLAGGDTSGRTIGPLRMDAVADVERAIKDAVDERCDSEKAKASATKAKALDVQEGGDHYKGMAIQPVEYCHRNGLGFIEGAVVKYVSRWRSKGGVEDLRKARHFLDILIELESGK